MRGGIAIARGPAPPWGGGQGAGSGVRRRLSGAASRAELRGGLWECCGRGWGGPGRRGGAGAGKGGEDGLHGAGVLHGGEDAQPATTAGTSEDLDLEHGMDGARSRQSRPGIGPGGRQLLPCCYQLTRHQEDLGAPRPII